MGGRRPPFLVSPGGANWTLETFTAGANTTTVWSVVSINELTPTFRLDAEYYQPHLLEAEKAFKLRGWPVKPLGHFVKHGYRVVYENTEILEDEFDPDRHVHFLQAADLLTSFPAINADSMGWVDRTDWDRYSNGHIRRGEILIEVKGKAEKVALVPDDFPENVLVTGTLYKMLIDEAEINRYYVLVYLLSQLGRGFRDRAKTNLLISFVSKDELYSIPVPVLPHALQSEIADLYLRSYTAFEQAQTLYAEAEELLFQELGLNDLDLSHELTYEGTFSSAWASSRLDAEYFQPKYKRVLDSLKALAPQKFVPLGEMLTTITNGHTPLHHDLNIGEIPFLTAEHVFDFRINYDTAKRILLEYHQGELSRTQLHTGDILITIKGRIGNAALVEHLPGDVNINQDVALMRLKPEYNPHYVIGFINSTAGKAFVDQICTGQINPFLGLGNLKQLPVPIFDNKRMDGIGEKLRQKVNAAYDMQQQGQLLLEEAKQKIEAIILSA